MKRAQARMMETIVILFIFFILIAFSAVFYVQYQKGATQERELEILSSRAMDDTLLVLFMPELTCTRKETEAEDNCFDVLKLNHIKTVIEDNKQYYFQLFGFAKIYVDQIYPIVTEIVEPEDVIDGEVDTPYVWDKEDFDGDGIDDSYKRWIIYDQEKKHLDEEGNEIIDWTNKESTPFIVSLKDETQKQQYGYGVLTVEVFS